MEKHQSADVQEAVDWEIYSYEEYIAGYQLYKQLKKIWGVRDQEQATNASSE